MSELFLKLISNRSFAMAGAWLGGIVTIIFIIMFARKQNRDERGWKIFGKASLVAFIWMLILVNVIAKLSGRIDDVDALGYLQYACTLQWVYDSTIMVQILSVFIIRTRE